MSDHAHHDAHHDDDHDHDRGLGFDLERLGSQRLARRSVVGGAGAVGALALLGSGGRSPAYAASCSDTEIPSETAGPYPGDGSNGPDALTESGIVRRDIRSSFDGASATAAGFPFWFTFVLSDTDTCERLAGLAVYAWHCTRDGKYSMYSQGITDQNYLRGVQVSDNNGKVTFRSIFPGCYSGRWPHVHFEVYRDADAATSGGAIVRTSQMALPRKQAMAVYQGRSGYAASVANLKQTSLSTDMVFSDDKAVHQLPAMRGGLKAGYFHATLKVPVTV